MEKYKIPVIQYFSLSNPNMLNLRLTKYKLVDIGALV